MARSLTQESRKPISITPVALLALLLVALAVLSLGVGRFQVDPWTVLRLLASGFIDVPTTWSPTEEAVVLRLRPPRILAAILVGAALAASGAAYQTMFRNPLVSPEILGVSAGAGFGASIAIFLGMPDGFIEILAFVFGLSAALLALVIARLVGSASLIVLVLGGIVIGAMFGALISITKYFANPETTLPEITFWLFGSLGRATNESLIVPTIIVGGCILALHFVRWHLTVLAIGEDEAQTLGVNRRLVWIVVIVSSTLMTATVVSVSGIIGWVGLVVPHLARFVVGPSFARQLPVSALMGACYLLGIDSVSRSITPLDLPVGILTALIGAPFFVFLLARIGRQWL